MLSSVLAFTVAAALLTLLPGADTLLVLRSAMRGGRRGGVLAGLGVCTGLLAWGAAAAFGVTAVLAASHLAYTALRLVGAAYLVWLGIRTWREFRTARPAGLDAEPSGGRLTGWSAYRSGLLTNLANPKVGVFYLTFLPQFVPVGYPVLPLTMLFVAIHATLGVLWLGLVASAVQRARAVLSRPAVARWLGRVAGAIFLGLGARLAFDAR